MTVGGEVAPMDAMSIELLRLLQRRAAGLARRNWGGLDAESVWRRDGDVRSDEVRISEEGEFHHVCAIIDRYVTYSEGDSASFYMQTSRAVYS